MCRVPCYANCVVLLLRREILDRKWDEMSDIQITGNNTPAMQKWGLAHTCVECGRVFDMFDETDAEEWHYGHDCEVN